MVLSASPAIGEGFNDDETVDGQEDVEEISDDNEEEDHNSISQSFTGFLSSVRLRVSKHLPGGEDDWARVEDAVKGRPRDETGDWEVLGTNLLQMFVEEQTVVAK